MEVPSIRSRMAGYSQVFQAQANRLRLPVIHPAVEGQFEDDVVEEQKPNKSSVEAIQGQIADDGKGEQGQANGANDLDDGWESSDDEFDYDNFENWGERSGPNSQAHQAALKNFQTSDELFRKYSSKISVGKYEGVESLPSGAGNKILTATKKAMSLGMKVKDKQDRATVEQVLDPRTRMILYKLLSSGKIVSIDGCISTGKEANVYHATGPENTALAIKIYKTSILTFKSRDKYVSGEFRFRQGYCKKNPRKMVRVWAEKEYRNLLRICSCGTIKVPHPKILKSHVLVMDFIGENGWPCPLLKDVRFSELDLYDQEEQDGDDPVLKLVTDLYRQCLLILYRLFKHCKLVHADFSEFNLILKDEKDLFVIDVSQSVEHDHPRSLDFLRHDIKNVQEFFGKHILVGDYKEIFEFITSPNIDDTNHEAILEGILKKAKKLESFNVANEVFRQTHIPRKMQEIVDYEKDYEKMKKGEKDLVYPKIMGMKSDMSGPAPDMLGPSSSDPNSGEDTTRQNIVNGVSERSYDGASESDSSSDSEDDSENEDGTDKKDQAARPKNESVEEKRQRKKQVKDEKAEKRKSKVKKHVKKRKEKLAHANSKR